MKVSNSIVGSLCIITIGFPLPCHCNCRCSTSCVEGVLLRLTYSLRNWADSTVRSNAWRRQHCWADSFLHCCVVLAAEEEILKQYERDTLFSEEALCAALDTLATNDVICPICQKYVCMYVWMYVRTCAYMCRESMHFTGWCICNVMQCPVCVWFAYCMHIYSMHTYAYSM